MNEKARLDGQAFDDQEFTRAQPAAWFSVADP
jgi:hypothetical protein